MADDDDAFSAESKPGARRTVEELKRSPLRFKYILSPSGANRGLAAADGSRHVVVADGVNPGSERVGRKSRVRLRAHQETLAFQELEKDSSVYEREFAARMRAVRLARARRAPDWAEQWRALEGEYEKRREQARLMLGSWIMDVDLHDGHVAEVELDARAFVERATELLLRAPWVRHLHLSAYREVGPSLFNCWSLRGMRSLGLPGQGLVDDDVEALVASPFVDGLRWLDLSDNHLTGRSFERIACCEPLQRLDYLGLAGNASESPVDRMGIDSIDGSVVHTIPTLMGRDLESKAGRRLAWLHAPESFPYTYPPSPLDVATSG